MSVGTCQVEGCDQPIKRQAYCYGHYMKNWRYGTPTPVHAPQHQPLAGRVFGSLTVVERQGLAWLCRCVCGQTTVVLSGDLNRGSVTTCGDSKHRRQSHAGYGAAHRRCDTDRGHLSTHTCVDCDAPARHWSYNHDDPNELHATGLSSRPVAYSLDPNHYSPRCVPCHKRFDMHRLNAAKV